MLLCLMKLQVSLRHVGKYPEEIHFQVAWSCLHLSEHIIDSRMGANSVIIKLHGGDEILGFE